VIDPELAAGAVRQAVAEGATDAECTLSGSEEFSTAVRMRQLESVTEAGSRIAGLRVLVGRRVGSSYSSDLSAEGIRKMIHSALDIAAISICPTLPTSARSKAICGSAATMVRP